MPPYTPAHRTTFEVKLMPMIDAKLSESLRAALEEAYARTLQFDGWEELLNFIVSSPAGCSYSPEWPGGHVRRPHGP